MADPIELLESFPRSLGGGAPNPDDLRKRGDRRRTRHRAAGATAIAAVLAAVVAPLALGRDGDSTTPPIGPPDATIKPVDGPSVSGRIPAGFPLMIGLPDWAAFRTESTAPLTFEACGQELSGAPRAVDTRRATAHRGAETFDRQVMTFADQSAAVAWVEAAMEFFQGCPSEPAAGGQLRHVVKVSAEDSGLPVSVFSRTVVDDQPQAGGQLDLLYVVGRAVLVARYVNPTVEGSVSEVWEVQQPAMATPAVSALGHTWVGFGDEQGVFVDSSAQTPTELDGASAGFQSFIGSLADELVATSECTDATAGVTIHYVVDDRWALGGVHQCGGYVALWGKAPAGTWTELLGTQEAWDCGDLEAKAVPEGVAGPCVDYES